MQTSDQIDQITADLVKAESVMRNVEENAVNPAFKSRYAKLDAILNVARPALTANGIALVQATEVTEDGVILRTRLLHKSGQWIESNYPVSKFDAHQKMAAALTYAKRMSLAALIGICGTQEDTDGAETEGMDTKVGAKPRPALVKPGPAKVDMLDPAASADLRSEMLMSLAEASGTREQLLAWAKANSERKATLQTGDAQEVSEAFAKAQAALKAVA